MSQNKKGSSQRSNSANNTRHSKDTETQKIYQALVKVKQPKKVVYDAQKRKLYILVASSDNLKGGYYNGR